MQQKYCIRPQFLTIAAQHCVQASVGPSHWNSIIRYENILLNNIAVRIERNRSQDVAKHLR